MEGARELATPTERQDAVRLLEEAWAPLGAAMVQVVSACAEATRSNSLAVLAHTRQWPEEAASTLAACGDRLIALMERQFLERIRQIPEREPPPVASALPLSGGKLELVSEERIDEDLAAASLVQSLHAQTQEQAQALAARLTHVFPSAYITEADVPIAAEFVAKALLDVLRDPQLDMMTSRVRVQILGTFGPDWIRAVAIPSHQINDALGQRGWLPDFTVRHVAEWRSHLAALRGGERPPARPVARKPSAPASPPPVAAEPAASLSGELLPASREAEFAWPQALDHSGLNAYAASFFSVEQSSLGGYPGFAEAGLGQLAQALQPLQLNLARVAPQLGVPLRAEAVRFAEAMLSQMQRLVGRLEGAQLVDTSLALRRQALRNGVEDLPEALTQRLVAAQEMIRALTSDDSFSPRAKTSIIRFQIPWTRFLVGEPRALLSPADPFMALIWRIAGICRRSGGGNAGDELIELVDRTYGFFEDARVVDASLVQRATDFLDKHWREMAERANAAISRSVAAWREEALAREHLESLKRLVRLWMRARPVRQLTAKVVDQELLPALQRLSMRMSRSAEDKAAFSEGKQVAKAFLRVVTATDEELVTLLDEWAPAYDAARAMIKAQVPQASLIDEDREAFAQRMAALAQGVVVAVPAEDVVVPEAIVTPPANDEPALPQVSEAQLARARALGVGTWVMFRDENAKWRGRIGSRIAFQDKVVFVDRSGNRLAELLHPEFAAHLDSGVITVIDDNTSFSKALESMIVSIRTERDKRA